MYKGTQVDMYAINDDLSTCVLVYLPLQGPNS